MGFFNDIPEFRQGVYGTCQTLAPINSIAQSAEGRAHLNSLIQQEGQSFFVTFPGKEPIEVTQAELMGDRNLASAVEGNSSALGVLILERAAIEHSAAIDGVPNSFSLLTGQHDEIRMASLGENGSDIYTKHLLEQQAQGNAAINFMSLPHPDGDLATYTFQTETGENIILHNSHGYSATVMEDGRLSIENPHDTSQPFIMSAKDANQAFFGISAGPMPGRNIEVPEQLREIDKAASYQASVNEEYSLALGNWNSDLELNDVPKELFDKATKSGQPFIVAAANLPDVDLTIDTTKLKASPEVQPNQNAATLEEAAPQSEPAVTSQQAHTHEQNTATPSHTQEETAPSNNTRAVNQPAPSTEAPLAEATAPVTELSGEEAAFVQFSKFGEGYEGHPYKPHSRTEDIKEYQTLLAANGADLGGTGPNKDGIDGDYGPLNHGAHLAFTEQFGIDPNTPPHEVVAMARAGELQQHNGVAATMPEGWSVAQTDAAPATTEANLEQKNPVIHGAQTENLVSFSAGVGTPPEGGISAITVPSQEHTTNVANTAETALYPAGQHQFAYADAGPAGHEVASQSIGSMQQSQETYLG